LQLPQAWWSQLFLFVSFDGVQETHIRMQSTPEEQGPLLSNLAAYLVAICLRNSSARCGALAAGDVLQVEQDRRRQRWRQVDQSRCGDRQRYHHQPQPWRPPAH
jgi:hypothetical protein